MISGIIPDWQETNKKEKKRTIGIMKSWMGEMMNLARIQMKKWTKKKNEHKAKVQRRWDDKGMMNVAFKRWKSTTGYKDATEKGGKEKNRDEQKEKTYGINLRVLDDLIYMETKSLEKGA
eukprot:6212928-Pleurochrysis_carterae.AAC.3